MNQIDETLYYDLALNFAKGIGPVMSSQLINYFGNAKSVFNAPHKQLIKIEGLGEQKVNSLKDKTIFEQVEDELKFIEKNKISVLVNTHTNYPKRLLHCVDAPRILYHIGNTDFNVKKVISVVGTRNHSEYGKNLCTELIETFANDDDTLVISGLANGIDAIAHKTALKHNIKTVGVLGHGLKMIYPSTNRHLATEMIQNGGLLSEFSSNTKIEKGNFPSRNRVVAGLADITIVVESDVKGGSMITAYMAHSYNRDVAAYPGRVNDSKSKGTNLLIQKNIASLITSGNDVQLLMNWINNKKQSIKQSVLLFDLDPESQLVVDILKQKDSTHADELLLKSNLNSSNLAATLLLLELQNIIKPLPGKFYQLNII